MKKIIFAVFVTILFLVAPASILAAPLSPAAPRLYEATVKSVKDKNITLELNEGPNKGKNYTVTAQDGPMGSTGFEYKTGDRLLVSPTSDQQGKESVYIAEYVRRRELLFLFFVFLAVIFAIGRWHGFFSFLGMIFSFLIIGKFVIPNIILGNDPVLISLMGALLIIPVTFYIAHGFTRKTTIAMVGTFISLVFTGMLSYMFVNLTRLTGFAAEEAMFIQAFNPGAINIKSLLLAGIIIGAMGVLDDITISQTSIVDKLKQTNPKFGFRELYGHGMSIGRDHIASLVNTLVLVYTGASLPLLLLFYNANMNFQTVINQEIIATEIVRTLVSSIGIVAAVPITTVLACFFIERK